MSRCTPWPSHCVHDAVALLEFFKEQVEAACERQKLRPQPLTSYYVVSLLAEFTHLGIAVRRRSDDVATKPLGVRLRAALRAAAPTSAPGSNRSVTLAVHLRVLFRQPAPQSRRRRLLRVARRLRLSARWVRATTSLSPIFAELAEKFVSLRRRAVRCQRADVAHQRQRSAAPLREVAPHRQPPKRRPPRRAGHRP